VAPKRFAHVQPVTNDGHAMDSKVDSTMDNDDRVGANEPPCPRSRQLRGDHEHRGNRIGVERFEIPRVRPHDGLNLRRRLVADP
jgi:hypothetical protein